MPQLGQGLDYNYGGSSYGDDQQNNNQPPWWITAAMGGAGQIINNTNFKNPYQTGSDELDKILASLPDYYKNYINTGNQMGPQLQQGYGQLMSNPQDVINKVGQGYQQSPGFAFAKDQALQAEQHAENAGGMAGSLQNQQKQGQLATNLANQDYWHYMDNALGQMDFGYSGGQNLYNTGATASQNLGENYANIMAAKAKMMQQAQQAQNQSQGSKTAGWLDLIPAGLKWLFG
jgi:hypothetical protein